MKKLAQPFECIAFESQSSMGRAAITLSGYSDTDGGIANTLTVTLRSHDIPLFDTAVERSQHGTQTLHIKFHGAQEVSTAVNLICALSDRLRVLMGVKK